MQTKLSIPRFKDGELLTEIDLNALAHLSFLLHGLSNQVANQVGFWGSSAKGRVYNQFYVGDAEIQITNVAVLTLEGFPIVVPNEQVLHFDDDPYGEGLVFASLYLAESSEAFEHPLFNYEGTRQEGELELNGYRAIAHWGEEPLEVPGAVVYTMELGSVVEHEFHPYAKALNLAALPELYNVCDSLIDSLMQFTALLLEPELVPTVDRSSLIDRLEVLVKHLQDDTPIKQLVSDVQLVVQAAKGFYFRVVYALEPQAPAYAGLEQVTGRVLEHALERAFHTDDDVLRAVLYDFVEFPPLPLTGFEQVQYFKALFTLLDVERHATLLRGLELVEPKQVVPPPRIPEPRPQRPRTKPNGPRIIDLNKDRD